MLPIRALWEKHLATTFPPELVGEEMEDIDLALLDGATMECIATYFERDGELDLRRTATLGLAHRQLAVIARELTGNQQEYFLRLEVLTAEVLRTVRDAAPEV